LREYGEARQYYQQAIAIKIEFSDRYSQARTYSQLGLLAEELGDLEEAKSNHLQDLQISKEFQDQNRLAFVTQNLSRIYQVTQDQSLLETMAKILDTSIEEILSRQN
jgi:tetratricopeptide (TPR) repeat protein